MIATTIGLTDKQRVDMAQSLNILLASEYVLYTKTLKFHWNIRSICFAAMHEFLNKQYQQLLDIVDTVAERVRALGELSLGSLQEFLKHSQVAEEPGKNPDDLGMIKQLLLDHELIIRLMRELSVQAAQFKDEGTVNMLGDLIETHEKMAWMLRAHLE